MHNLHFKMAPYYHSEYAVKYINEYAQYAQSVNCRVLLGDEIYYRAIGQPWGPAADFIVKFLQSVGPLAGCPGYPRAVGATPRLTHSSSIQAGREYSGPPSAGRPPEPSVCPQSVCPGPPVFPPVRSCCPSGKPAFRSGPVKKKHQGVL